MRPRPVRVRREQRDAVCVGVLLRKARRHGADGGAFAPCRAEIGGGARDAEAAGLLGRLVSLDVVLFREEPGDAQEAEEADEEGQLLAWTAEAILAQHSGEVVEVQGELDGERAVEHPAEVEGGEGDIGV